MFNGESATWNGNPRVYTTKVQLWVGEGMGALKWNCVSLKLFFQNVYINFYF